MCNVLCVAGTANTGVVQGSASLTNSAIDNGNLVYCGSLSLSQTKVTDGSATYNCNSFDFQDSCLFVNYWATKFGGLAPTSVASVSTGHYTLTADASLNENIFSVSGSDWAAVASLTINSGPGTFVIINIDGDADVFSSFVTTLVGGINAHSVIYNFYNATSLTVSSIAVKVCAPLFFVCGQGV